MSALNDWLATASTPFLLDYARRAWDRGLVVHKEDGRVVPIPLVLEPLIVEDAGLRSLSDDAGLVLGAAVTVAKAVLGDPEHAWLWAGFTPLERDALRAANLDEVVTARVDCFDPSEGPSLVLELNATIPAMQGYSDIATHGWIRAVGAARGLPDATIDALLQENGSNTDDLLAGIDAAWRRRTGRHDTPAILVVSRRGDAQLGELQHYVRTWTAGGRIVGHALAEDVRFDGGRPTANGRSYDLVYRHIFARRIDPSWPLADALRDPEGPVWNPVTSLLEVKGLLGVVHAAAAGDGPQHLTDEMRAAVLRRVPWTRLLRHGPSRLPHGDAASDLVAWATAHPDEVVVKRSWDYGGKSVFIGVDSAAQVDKMAQIYPGVTDWGGFLTAAAADHDAPWVVQALIDAPTHEVTLIDEAPDGAMRTTRARAWLDRNAYANRVGAPVRGPGVTRASTSRIVNILGGGGVVPVLRASVANALFAEGGGEP